MSEVEVTGPTVEEAIASALGSLGVGRDEVEVEVLEEPSGETEARVLVRKRSEDQDSQAREESDEPLDLETLLEYAKEDTLDFLEGLLDAAGLDGEVRVDIENQGVQAKVVGEDLGALIGRHGATLDAVQELLRVAVQRQARARVRVNLDIEGYRERRRQVLEEQTEGMAQKALRQGEIALEPMPAYERKVVHDTVGTISGVTSFSEGEEPYRRVVIRSTQEPPPESDTRTQADSEREPNGGANEG